MQWGMKYNDFCFVSEVIPNGENVNRNLHVICRMVPFSMTLNDP